MQKNFKVLLVEDSPLDIRLVEQALGDSKAPVVLSVLRDGEAAINYLATEDAARIDLILLDLNLPLKNGMEVLAALRQNPKVDHVPVIILTTSNDQDQVLQAYRNRANAYVHKAIDADIFMERIKALVAFWFQAASLPHRDP